jgi:hypothetical protein
VGQNAAEIQEAGFHPVGVFQRIAGHALTVPGDPIRRAGNLHDTLPLLSDTILGFVIVANLSADCNCK